MRGRSQLNLVVHWCWRSEKCAKGKRFKTCRGTRREKGKICMRKLGNMEKKKREKWS